MGTMARLLQTWWIQSSSHGERDEGRDYEMVTMREEAEEDNNLSERRDLRKAGEWDDLSGPRADRLL